jgi:hypothetical protein
MSAQGHLRRLGDVRATSVFAPITAGKRHSGSAAALINCETDSAECPSALSSRRRQAAPACPFGARCGNGLSLPVLDVRQTIFKGDQTAINNEKLRIRRADPMLLCLLKSEP